MVGIAEAFALLVAGFVAGIISTLIDVAILGTDAFVAHFALWVLLNALVAIHVDSRLRAILWSIPFSLGFIEFYYVCTAASFEGYGKSLIIPLVAMALISPLLTYALWTAKRDRGPYGKILSILISAGVVGAGYYLYGDFDMYTIVIAVVLLFIMLFWPARRLKFVPAMHPPAGLEEDQVRESSSRRREVAPRSRELTPRGRAMASVPEVEETFEDDDYAWDEPSERVSQRRGRYGSDGYDGYDDYGDNVEEPARREPLRSGRNNREAEEPTQERRRATRRTRRRSSSDDVVTTRGARSRRSVREREEDNREAQRRAAVQRRARRERSSRNERENNHYTPTISTLGTVRTVRPSSRSSRSRYSRYE